MSVSGNDGYKGIFDKDGKVIGERWLDKGEVVGDSALSEAILTMVPVGRIAKTAWSIGSRAFRRDQPQIPPSSNTQRPPVGSANPNQGTGNAPRGSTPARPATPQPRGNSGQGQSQPQAPTVPVPRSTTPNVGAAQPKLPRTNFPAPQTGNPPPPPTISVPRPPAPPRQGQSANPGDRTGSMLGRIGDANDAGRSVGELIGSIVKPPGLPPGSYGIIGGDSGSALLVLAVVVAGIVEVLRR